MIKLLQGDCLELMKDIPDKSIDMILCDLPYGCTNLEWDKELNLNQLWGVYKKIIKNNGAIVLFSKQPFSAKLVMSNISMFKYEYIWKKERPTNPLLCKKRPPEYHENILVFYKRQPKFYLSYIKRDIKNKRNNRPRDLLDKVHGISSGYKERVLSGANDYIYQPDILEFSMERKYHVSQKPVKLLEQLIKTYTDENDLVLDNCMGSGSTGVACINTKRNFIGMEINPNYFEIAQKRLAELKGE